MIHSLMLTRLRAISLRSPLMLSQVPLRPTSRRRRAAADLPQRSHCCGTANGCISGIGWWYRSSSALITVGTNNFGDITITYASGGAVTDASFALAKSTGTAGTDDAAAVIIDGGTGAAAASAALSKIDTAMTTVATKRAALGATQVQLESTVRNLANVAENTAAAAGRIMDTDYAAETANLTKAQILQQAATSILAQANAQPQAVLSLLQ